MRVVSLFIMLACLLGMSGIGYCDTNPIAAGTERLTKTPFTMLKGASDHLFTPVKEMNHGVLFVTDEARAATVSAALNLGQPVEY